MTEQQLDAQGEAHEALGSVVNDYGQRVLSDPRMIGNLVTDLLPDLPKERSLLVTAAEADVAGELRRHVQEQHLDPNTAVQLVARSLTDRKSIDPVSSMWVATQYAQALGYPVQPGASRRRSRRAEPASGRRSRPAADGHQLRPVRGAEPADQPAARRPDLRPRRRRRLRRRPGWRRRFRRYPQRPGGIRGSQPPSGGGFGGAPQAVATAAPSRPQAAAVTAAPPPPAGGIGYGGPRRRPAAPGGFSTPPRPSAASARTASRGAPPRRVRRRASVRPSQPVPREYWAAPATSVGGSGWWTARFRTR